MTSTQALNNVQSVPVAGAALTTVPPVVLGPTTKRKGFGLAFWLFSIWLGIVLIWAIFGKHLPFAHRDNDYITSALINDGKWTKTFSWSHPLGTDQNGNDWLSAAVVGARNSMIIAFATILFGFIVGFLFATTMLKSVFDVCRTWIKDAALAVAHSVSWINTYFHDFTILTLG